MAGYNDKLNNKIDSPFAFQIEQESFLDNRTQYQYLKNGSLQNYTPDYLDATSIFKGVALRVEQFAAPLSEGPPGAESADIEGLSYLRVRVRIPEIHSHIPDPCGVNGVSADRAIIEMHPLFVSLEPASNDEIPRPGSIVRVSFGKGPKGGVQSEGIYHGIFKRAIVAPEAPSQCGVLRTAFREASTGGNVQYIENSAIAGRTAPPANTNPDTLVTEITQTYPKISPTLARKMISVANAVGAHPYDLVNLIGFETSFTFSNTIENGGCVSRNGADSGKCAVGLIQFMPFTAAALFGMPKEGFDEKGRPDWTFEQKRAAYLRMKSLSKLEQMDYVLQYLRPYKPLDTPYKVAMAVFYPAALRWDPNRTFSRLVRSQNPGVNRPSDYTRKLFENAKLPLSVPIYG